jgi:hypothetical protein
MGRSVGTRPLSPAKDASVGIQSTALRISALTLPASARSPAHAYRPQSPIRNGRAMARLSRPSRSIVPPGCHCSRPRRYCRRCLPARWRPEPDRYHQCKGVAALGATCSTEGGTWTGDDLPFEDGVTLWPSSRFLALDLGGAPPILSAHRAGMTSMNFLCMVSAPEWPSKALKMSTTTTLLLLLNHFVIKLLKLRTQQGENLGPILGQAILLAGIAG